MSKPLADAKTLAGDTSKTLMESDQTGDLYDRLAALQVELDDDPLSYGPKRLQGKIAQSRRALHECENIYLVVNQRQHKARRELRAKRVGLDMAVKFLLSNDPDVRAGRNVHDRDALAAVKLKDEWLEVRKWEQMVEDLDNLMNVTKAKRTDLKDVQGRLRDQIRLCQTELDLGGRWGSKLPATITGPNLKPGLASDDDLTDIDALISGLEQEVSLPELESLPGILTLDEGDPIGLSIRDEPPLVAIRVEQTLIPAAKFVAPNEKLDDLVADLEQVDWTQVALPSVSFLPEEEDQETVSPDQLLPSSYTDQDVDDVLLNVDLPMSLDIKKASSVDDNGLDSLIDLLNE